MRNPNADQDTIYVVAKSYTVARNVATLDWDYTGNGQGKGQGPRPWVYLRDALAIRGRQFKADASDVRFIEGWWDRPDASEMLEYVQLSSRLA